MSKKVGGSEFQSGSGQEHNQGHHHNFAPVDAEGLDPASKALADALRISFVMLKVIMFCMAGLFAWTCLYTVGPNEQAIELRFGKIKGYGLSAVNGPGPHWKWPEPIEEAVMVPSKDSVRQLDINSFWHYVDRKAEAAGKPTFAGETLQFAKDGYSLTASQSAVEMSSADGIGTDSPGMGIGALGVDYNIVHSQWRLRYRVVNPLRFFEQLWDGTEGTSGKDEGWYAVNDFLRKIVSNAVIVTSANHDIREILWDNVIGYQGEVKRLVEERLAVLDVGLEIIGLDLVEKIPPRQVKRAFDAAQQARNEAKRLVSDAGAQSSEIVDNAKAAAAQLEAEAKSYYTKVVESASADAGYLTEVTGKIEDAVNQRVPGDGPDALKQRQQAYNDLLAVTVDQLYQEMLREVLVNADETFVMPASGSKPLEMRVYMSRDAMIPARERDEALRLKRQQQDELEKQQREQMEKDR